MNKTYEQTVYKLAVQRGSRILSGETWHNDDAVYSMVRWVYSVTQPRLEADICNQSKRAWKALTEY